MRYEPAPAASMRRPRCSTTSDCCMSRSVSRLRSSLPGRVGGMSVAFTETMVHRLKALCQIIGGHNTASTTTDAVRGQTAEGL